MGKVFDIHSKDNREKHNKDIIKRMKSGEPLQMFTAQSSWFPPRPVIKKDQNAIDMIYKDKRESSHSNLHLTKTPS